MRHRYVVGRYDKRNDAHICTPTDGSRQEYIDIMVDGGLGGETDESIIGKTISCDYIYPYISIAMGVKVEEP